MTKRFRPLMAAAMASRSGLVVIVVVGVVATRAARGGIDLVQELFDTVLSGDRFVVVKLELGRTPQTQRLADAAAQERRGAGERPGGVLSRGPVVAARRRSRERCVVDARELQVGRHLDARQRQEPDAGIVDLARNQVGELAADLIRYSIR